ncbi:MAG: hypothetical protein EAZ27_08565 [Cytophagales bacterium]|nr:MAG: hypothetical protein EAZ27_08565 [Cytophagales bacterium]
MSRFERNKEIEFFNKQIRDLQTPRHSQRLCRTYYEERGTPKNLNSVEALPFGFCVFVAEIGLGGVFKNNIGVFRDSL